MSLTQRPFDNLEFARNPENRVACVLLLDTSYSMSGKKLAQLNAGIDLFAQAVRSDELAAKRCDVAIISFGPVSLEQDFCSVDEMQPSKLRAHGGTPMGAAVLEAIDVVENRKSHYKQAGIPYYRPWIFMITDGEPTDSITQAQEAIKQGEKDRKFSFFAVGVDQADLTVLQSLSVKDPVHLRGMAFEEMFRWLSASMIAVSESQPGEEITLKNPSGWATY